MGKKEEPQEKGIRKMGILVEWTSIRVEEEEIRRARI